MFTLVTWLSVMRRHWVATFDMKLCFEWEGILRGFGCSRNIHGGITSAVAIIQLVSLSKCTCVIVLSLISGAQSWRHWRRKFDNYYNYWLAASTTYLSGHLAIRVVCCALSYSVGVFVCLVLCLYCPVKHAECCMLSLLLSSLQVNTGVLEPTQHVHFCHTGLVGPLINSQPLCHLLCWCWL